MENTKIEFHKITEKIPQKNIPIWLLIQIDGDNILFEGTFGGIVDETCLFQIKSGGLCSPLAWTEFDNVPQIPVF